MLRDLHRYKYQLMNDYSLQISIRPPKAIKHEFMSLSTKGQ